eukprot:253880_1
MLAFALVIWFISLLGFRINLASFKTGAIFTSKINCDDLDTLSSAKWWFNWKIVNEFNSLNCTQTRTDIEYVPMKWGWSHSNNISAIQFPEQFTTILGFFQPNKKTASNLSPSAAVDAWKAIQNRFPDKTLVSPSAAPCIDLSQCLDEFGSQQAWFDEFFRLCNDTCRVDYIAVPLYWCYLLDNHTVHDWIGVLRNIYNRYGLEIWLTEFNCVDAPVHQQKLFMQEVLPVLELTPWIARYAWATSRPITSSTAQLLTSNASESKLTELGELYNVLTADSNNPSEYPSSQPTNQPILHPTNIPSRYPSSQPSFNPTNTPTVKRQTIVVYPNHESTQNPSAIMISSTDNTWVQSMDNASISETNEKRNVDVVVVVLIIIIVIVVAAIVGVSCLYYDFKRTEDVQVQQNMIGMNSAKNANDSGIICEEKEQSDEGMDHTVHEERQADDSNIVDAIVLQEVEEMMVASAHTTKGNVMPEDDESGNATVDGIEST